MNIKIIEAKKENINQVGKLFDLYRQFYKYESNIQKSTNYISDRINNKQSTIFLAIAENDNPAGFVQLYETFGSLHLGKIIILYVQNSQEEKWLKNAVKGLNNIIWK